MNEVELFTTLLLVNHVVSLVSNQFQVRATLDFDYTNLLKPPPFHIVGICSLHNLINHSCDPNAATAVVKNNKQILFATQPIKKGEQIFISYCGLFAEIPVADRIMRLESKFHFKCDCKACVNKWPLMMDLEKNKIKFLVGNKEEAILVLKQKMDLVLRGRNVGELSNDEIFQLICMRCDWLYASVKNPSFETVFCKRLLMRYFMWMCDTFLDENLTIAEMTAFVDSVLTTIMVRCLE